MGAPTRRIALRISSAIILTEGKTDRGVIVMPSESQRVAIVREHMSWGHRFALFWLMLCLVIFGGAYALAEMGAVAAVDRPLLFIMLGTIIITSAVWQTAALALARVENLILPRTRS
jgi:hypothetical protein